MNLKKLTKYGRASRVKGGVGSLEYGYVVNLYYIIIDPNAIEDVLEKLIDISIKDLEKQAKKSGKKVSEEEIEFVKDNILSRAREPLESYKNDIYQSLYKGERFEDEDSGKYYYAYSFDEIPENKQIYWLNLYNRKIALKRLDMVVETLDKYESYTNIKVKEFYHLKQDDSKTPNLILMRGENNKNYFFNADLISFVLKYVEADDLAVSGDHESPEFNFVCKFYSGGDLMAVVAGYKIPDLADTDIDELKKSIETRESMFNSIEEIKI